MRKDLLTDTMQPKKDLVRIVVDKEKNVSVDPSGKKPGRGAYVSLEPRRSLPPESQRCWNAVWA